METQVLKDITSPRAGDVHVNRPLTDLSVAYMQADDAFIATKMFRTVNSQHQSDQYYEYPKDEWFRDDMEERADGTESSGSGYPLDTKTFTCRVWSHHRDVTDRMRANQDSPIALDSEATEFLTGKYKIHAEREVVRKFWKDGVWTLEATGAGSRSGNFAFGSANKDLKYWDAMDATFVKDVKDAKIEMVKRTGFMPNVMAFGGELWNAITEADPVIERLNRGQTSGPAMADRQAIAALCGLDEILVGSSIYNSAASGLSADLEFAVPSKSALLAYRPASAGVRVPAPAYRFAWTGFVNGGEGGYVVKDFRMEHLEADRVELSAAEDWHLVSADLAVWFNGMIA